jgi:hypothetical protein
MPRMTRMIISIHKDEKQGLEAYSRKHHVSGAEIVRKALREFLESRSNRDLAGVLQETAGAWTSLNGDGQDYVDAMRDEWERER